MRNGVGTSTVMSLTEGDLTIDDGKLAEALWIFAILLIIAFSIIGNITICFAVFKHQTLRKPCFYILCNSAVADCIRACVIFPLVILSLWTGKWVYGKFLCDMIAFFNIYLYYGALYTTLFLSVERYLVVRFHRFHRQKLTGLACLLAILFAWALAIATAFPPILNPNAYDYSPAEYQCTFKRDGYANGVSETGYYAVFFVSDNLLILLFYMRVFIFMRTHRKMRPIQFVPAISGSWTFYGPGSTGQAATNWFLGYRQNAAPPPLVAPVPPANRAHLALSNHNFPMEERLSKMFFLIAVFNAILWTPYMIHCAGIAFKIMEVPNVYITNFTWLTFLQTCVSPLICVCAIPEVRMFCCACTRKIPSTDQELHQVTS